MVEICQAEHKVHGPFYSGTTQRSSRTTPELRPLIMLIGKPNVTHKSDCYINIISEVKTTWVLRPLWS